MAEHRSRSPASSRAPWPARHQDKGRSEPPGSGRGGSAAHSPTTSLLCQGHDENATSRAPARPTTSGGFSPVAASPGCPESDARPGPSTGATPSESAPVTPSGKLSPRKSALRLPRKSVFSNFLHKITESKGIQRDVVSAARKTNQRKPQTVKQDYVDASRLRELLDRSAPMHESPPSSGMSLPMAGGKMAGQCLFWGAVGTGALLIVALLLLTRKTSALCNSEACRYYGRLLAGSLNTSVDPCNDFHSYVCSGWEAVHHRSVMGFVYEEFIRKVARKVGRTHVPAEHQTAILKAAKFFQSCQKVYTERSSDLGAVRSLLAQAGVLWPEMSTSARLLPMIFSMAAAWNWGAVIELLTDKPGLFTVRPASVYYLTLQRRRSMLGISDEGKYRKYFDKMAQAFRRSNASALPFEELVKLEQRVVPRLQRSYDAPFFNTLPNASLDQVALMTAGATNVSAWRKQLVAHFNATPAAGGRYSFMVENREFFSAFFALVAEVGEPQMAYYVGWATVQVMALLSNADLIRYYFLSDAEAEAGHAQFCAGLTHMYMGLAFYADYIRLEIKGHETLGVIAIVRTIRQSYSESLSSSAFNHLASGVPWLADTAADEQDESTFELVRSAKDEGALDRLFREFPNMTGDVLDNIAVATQARRRTPADTTMERFIANQTHRVLYLRSGHFKFLPTAFEVPVYHAEAPLAINYGALGSEIANAFTALLYRALVQSDNDTWRAFLGKASCVLGAPVSPGARLFEGVNLEVMQRATSVRLLHQAFVRAFGQTPQPRLEDLREVDDAQLLFIAWCFSQCGRPGARHLCNEPLAVLPAFGRVFSCRSGSPLYSGKECAVLH